LSYLKDARTEVRVHDLKGKFVRNVDLPGIGTASGFGGKRKDKETFYAFTSFIYPTTIYRYDPGAGKSSVFRQPKVDFDAARFETKQVFYNSKDGTRIPMFLTYKKGLKLDGQNPTLLYAYGGFDISLTPNFSVPNVVWLEMGGIYAQPNLRGGGEYGEDWHLAGTKAKKQNVFDDFISAAEWLIANKYTSTPKLAIRGGSNGGLLVGAALTQRPDLFGATLPLVGVMDMLRFQKFTIGWAWASDYGSSDNAEDFKALYAYSPLHNLKPGTKYPPTLIATADHDDRVMPAHSFKFAATMQADQAGPAPVLIRIETKAGHGAGKPISKIIGEMADEWAFVAHNLNMNVTLP
jgi:prolyl oligopeptidase